MISRHKWGYLDRDRDWIDRIMSKPDMSDRVEALWPHLTNMTPDELRAHIVKIRAERRLIKRKVTTAKNPLVTSSMARDRARKLLGDMDPEAMARMLKDLEP